MRVPPIVIAALVAATTSVALAAPIGREVVVHLTGTGFSPAASTIAYGDRVRFTLFRSGALREIAVVLGKKENVTWAIRKTKSPTAIQKRIYESWLGNPWDPPKKK